MHPLGAIAFGFQMIAGGVWFLIQIALPPRRLVRRK